jgi:hypothetical protein
MIIAKRIKSICSRYPNLGVDGFEDIIVSKPNTNRQDLLEKLNDIAFVVEWLSGVEKTQKITGKCGSSHRLSRLADCENKHIDNGVFIVGAIIAGFSFERTNTDNGLSVYFNMSCRSIQRKIGKRLPFETGYSCLGI